MAIVKSEVYFEHRGFCCICDEEVMFSANGPYFRSTLRCPSCKLAPRHRALFSSLNKFFPNWREMDIHESSPCGDLVSARLAREAKSYTATQWDPSIPFGSTHPKGYRAEDLQAQTFADATFDLVVTQDVFEHIFEPDRAIKEIARTLRPGGAFIATVPIILKTQPSRRRASLVDGEIVHHLEAQYHGNPISNDGSLVVIDWGYDIVSYLQCHSGLNFIMIQIDNIDLGIRAEYIEVLVGTKQPLPDLSDALDGALKARLRGGCVA
jgi:Methyltransferase domain